MWKIKPENYTHPLEGKELPLPKMPSIDENSLREVIECRNRLFDIHGEMIDYFRCLPDIVPQIRQRAHSKGHGYIMPDGGYICSLCNHYEYNVKSDNPKGVDVDPYELFFERIEGCIYEETSTRWAKPAWVDHGKWPKKIYMLKTKPCVGDEAAAEILLENGLLDKYEVFGKTFNFPSSEEFRNAKNRERFLIDPTKPIFNQEFG